MSFSVSYKKCVGYVGSKYSEGFLELTNMNRLAQIVTSCVWSPIVWNSGSRNSKNFKHACFMVLDFDQPGEESMEQINNLLQDHKRIIAITRNHMKDKKGLICERYRLVVPFDQIITDLDLYKHNMECAIKKYPWADSACKDGGRFFYPSSKVVYIDRDAEYSWETKTQIPVVPASVSKKPGNRIPPWCLNFINLGLLCKNNSRNLTVYAVAYELLSRGYEENKVKDLIKRAPVEWRGVNIDGALASAKGKITQ